MDSADLSADSTNESPAQRQARLRRERRAAKILAEGASRLDKITGASGRPAPAPEEPSSAPSAKPQIKPTTIPSQPTPPAPTAADDPEEIDISQHYYQPASRSSTPAQRQAQDNAALQNFDPFAMFGQPPPNGQADTPMNQDPMMQMLQAMMGGGASGGGNPFGGFPGASAGAGGDMGGLPPGMAEMLGALGGGGATPEQAQTASSTAYLWRIVHAVFSLALGIYIAWGSNFTGSSFARTHQPSSAFAEAALVHHQTVGQRLFYLFATLEVVLQSSRYFLEKGQLTGPGWLGTISKFLPEPYSGYVRIFGRYSMIYTTVVADAMVVVFVLGMMAWWQGGQI